MMNNKYYRAEIDGLRAVAVIAVVLFHAGIAGFSGGFVGVDIFFVISGYLITTIILRDLHNGTFSFQKFFERRMRRILPILVVVVLTIMIAGYCLLLFQDELLDLGQSVFALSIFLSNVFFLRSHGYFEASADTFPLLHTWSLSVEEQFYIVFPLILFFAFRYTKRNVSVIIATIGVLSFLISVYWVQATPGANFSIPFLPDFWEGTTNQTAGFYLLPSRAWELMVGAFVATTVLSFRSRWFAEIGAVGGFVAILYSVTQFTEATAFPGIPALLPTLGSALFIIANTNGTTYIGKILSLPYIVWIGLISYSLYLWHWPIFVFSDVILVHTSVLQTIGLIVISVVLSWCTYVFIETPFRMKVVCSSRIIIIAGLSILVILACLGYSLKYVDVALRTPQHAKEILAESYEGGDTFVRCQSGTCMLGSEDENIKPSFVFWGDSNATMLLDVVDRTAKRDNQKGVYFSYPACAPIENVSASVLIEGCEKINDEALMYIASHDIKNILFVGAWGIYVRQHADGNSINMIGDDLSQDVSVTDSERVFETNFSTMLKRMHDEGRNVFVLKQIPRQENFDARTSFYNSIQLGEVVPFQSESLVAHEAYTAFTNNVFDTLERESIIVTLDPKDILCGEIECKAFAYGKIVYEDPGHLNAVGSRMLDPLIEQFIDSVGRDD